MKSLHSLLGLLFLLGVCASCGKVQKQASFSDASAVAVSVTKDYPGVVMILIPGGGLCTGTFISPRAVLTAAHCTPRAGSYSVLSSFGSFVTSHYEKFGEGVVEDPNDIAILMFDKNYANAEEGQIHPIGTSVRAGETVQIVGYGCNDLSARTGSGKKRKGTNQIETVNDYIELASPDSIPSMHSDSRGILGPSNRAGSCFGDSGGPMFQTQKGNIAIVGATHAGGTDGNTIVSQYIDLNRADNLDFIHRVDSRHSLQVFDTCIMNECKYQGAFMQITTFLTWIWTSIQGLFFSLWQ